MDNMDEWENLWVSALAVLVFFGGLKYLALAFVVAFAVKLWRHATRDPGPWDEEEDVISSDDELDATTFTILDAYSDEYSDGMIR